MAAPIDALMIDLFGGPRSYPWLRIAKILAQSGNWKAVALIRLGQYFHGRRWRWAFRWTARTLRREFGCFVQPTAVIGPGLKLPHPNGIVIGSGVRIGAKCIIYQQVTLGGARRGDFQSNAYPGVGDRVTLFTGAKVLGAISIGDDAQIGANAVVLRDVPPAHSAAGVPAQCRPLSRSGDTASHTYSGAAPVDAG